MRMMRYDEDFYTLSVNGGRSVDGALYTEAEERLRLLRSSTITSHRRHLRLDKLELLSHPMSIVMVWISIGSASLIMIWYGSRSLSINRYQISISDGTR